MNTEVNIAPTRRSTHAQITALLILTACSPSEQAIKQAIDATSAAAAAATTATGTPAPPDPTATQTPAPTDTAVPSPTKSPAPSETPTATASPTATPDLRVIELDSKNFLLQSSDLPAASQYYLPNSNRISPHLNTEILSGWGEQEGREYLELTGRIEGWWVWYDRGSQAVRAPENIYHNIIRYETAEGARRAVTDFSISSRNSEYNVVEIAMGFVDVYDAAIRKETQSNGNNKVWLYISFAYRNYVSTIGGWGWEDEVKTEYLVEIARLSLAKLEAAPLVEPQRTRE
jgi:hypothetical protein